MKLCMGCMEQYDDDLKICPHCNYEEGTEQENALHMSPGSIINERYIVGKVIGYGGFGVTYIGWDPLLETKIAIKEYLPSEFSTRVVGQTEVTVFSGDKQQQFTDGMKKFIDEAKKLAKFNSTPGIVKIFDSFEANNTAYIIMELLEGETLAEKIKREKTISEDKTIEMMIPIIESLNIVHKDGIIHRDIAPDNIFVTNSGEVKLIDFGAARYATTTHSRSLTVIIKPGYSPEEQYRSRGDQGPHTDVYAVAATMYKMLTGETPPDALERRAFFENKKKDILPSISKYNKDIEQNHETAILNALNVRIEDRTSTMEAFMEELTSVEPLKRRAGKIKKIDVLKWPMWAKIGAPTLATALVAFAVLFATGVIKFDAHLKKDIIIPDGQTRVPSVISNERDIGEEKLTDAKLQMVITGYPENAKLAENLILTQDINGGSVVQENSLVSVQVSAGIVSTNVPDVTGLEKDEAIQQLEELQFAVKIEEKYDNTIAEGCIISQSLIAGDEVDRGSEITLVVSKGRDPSVEIEEKDVVLPNFIGMKYSDVLKAAQELDLTIKVVDKRYSKGYEKDTVMEQNPEGGSTIKNTATVEIVVSLGYEQVEVPKVVLMKEDEAVKQLTSYGLRANVTYKEDNTVEAGRVISQSPDEKTKVDPESSVELIVSTGASSFEMPNVVGMKEDKARETLLAKNLTVSINYEQDDNKNEGEVLMQSISAGSDVKRGDTIILTVCTHSSIISVPYVIGLKQSEAESEIKNAGLKSNVVTVYSSSVEKGYVIAQSPIAGSGSHKNDLVTINISLGKDPNDVSQNIENNSSKPDTSNDTGKDDSSKSDVVVVEPDEKIDIWLDAASVELTEGDTYKLSYSTDPSKWSMTLSQNWKSSDSSIVSIDGNGNLTAKKAGTATITFEATGKSVKGNTVTSSATCNVTVKALIIPANVSLSETNLIMEISETKLLTATITPANAYDKSVTWSSSDSSVVTVDNGHLTAVSDGKATVTAKTINGKTATCTVKVNEIAVKSIVLNETSVTLTEGNTKQLSATVTPSNAKNKTITWSSSDSSVADVNSSGLITAKKEGTAKITAKSSNGVTAVCNVTVEPIVPSSISLDQSSYTFYEGDTLELTATVSPSNAKDKSVTWSSSNTSVATVSNGKVTAINEGTATITASTFNGKKATCSITVKAILPDSITLNKTGLTLDEGSSEQLTATISPSNAKDKSVTWSSSDTSVASVSNGKVTGVSAGSATITAKSSNGLTVSCSVTVKEILLTGVSLNYSSYAMNEGDTVQLTATVSPSNAKNKNVTWSSSNTSVATVSNGLVTAKSIGTATITVKTSNNKTTTCLITVKDPWEGYTKIYSASDLNNIRNNLSGNYVLMNDLVCNNWTPIGGYYDCAGNRLTSFSGVLDGNGHSIELSIDYYDKAYQASGTIYITGYSYYAGLFSRLDNAKIKDLNISANIYINIDTYYKCVINAGGVCGYADHSEIKNCNIYGSINAKSNYCVDSAGADMNVGGIAGEIDVSTIDSSNNYSTITSYNNNTLGASIESGGIGGSLLNKVKINNCGSYGNIYGTVRGDNIYYLDAISICIGGIGGKGFSGSVTDCSINMNIDAENYYTYDTMAYTSLAGVIAYTSGGSITASNCSVNCGFSHSEEIHGAGNEDWFKYVDNKYIGPKYYYYEDHDWKY